MGKGPCSPSSCSTAAVFCCAAVAAMGRALVERRETVGWDLGGKCEGRQGGEGEGEAFFIGSSSGL